MLNVSNISLNVKKTEIVIFKSKRKKFNDIVKIKLSGKRIYPPASVKYPGVKRIYPPASVKYPGVKIDQNLTWQHHINDLSVKLKRAKCSAIQNQKVC